MTKQLWVFGFPGIYSIYIYIYEVPRVHESMSLINEQWMKGSPHHPFWLKGFSMKSTIPYYCGSPMTLEPPHGTPKNAWVIISLPIKCLCYGYNVNPNFQTSPQSASEDVSPQALLSSPAPPVPSALCHEERSLHRTECEIRPRNQNGKDMNVIISQPQNRCRKGENLQ